jgi:tRNA pseudouridine38-40 synthase
VRLSDQALPPGQRFAARVEYHGGHYHGWQSQPHLPVSTVQEEVEAALARVANVPVRTVCAGRTDAGVHGFGQIIHFDAPTQRSVKAWTLGTNRHLPGSIRLHWVTPVNMEFHARFSALSRRYRYVVLTTPVRSGLVDGLVCWCRQPLKLESMQLAATVLIGEHDFSAFRAAGCQSTSPVREVTHCSVKRLGDYVVIDIVANAFLHHMVRNIAGSLLAVGSGRYPAAWLGQTLRGRDRTVAAETAPADGLYLVQVRYPEAFNLPDTPEGPTLLSACL